jgi:histidine triad (HIT) family protein
MSECIFCAVVAGEAPAEILYRDEHAVAFLDIAPLARGHTLVVPVEHCVDLYDIGPARGAAVMRAALEVAKTLNERLSPDGMNLLHASGAAAWQTVFHFHLHLLPRSAGDAVRPMFTSRRRATPDELAEVAGIVRS